MFTIKNKQSYYMSLFMMYLSLIVVSFFLFIKVTQWGVDEKDLKIKLFLLIVPVFIFAALCKSMMRMISEECIADYSRVKDKVLDLSNDIKLNANELMN